MKYIRKILIGCGIVVGLVLSANENAAALWLNLVGIAIFGVTIIYANKSEHQN